MTKYSQVWLAAGLIVLAVISRWLPHPPNFTPILGVALYAGSRISSRRGAFIIPLLALFISDLWLGWHSTLIFVYGAMALTVLLGKNPIQAQSSFARQWTSTAALSSVLFFLITNFGVWLTQDLYTRSFAGLAACFLAAVPFFPATLVSTLFYTLALFGLDELIHRNFRLERPIQS